MAFYLGRKSIRKVPGAVIKIAPLPEPALTEGYGSRAQAGALAAKAGYKSVLLVTDQTLYGLGFHKKVQESLEKEGIRCTVFSDINSEPTIAIVEAGRQAALECGADCIVALGGGSVLDSGKVIAASSRHPNLPIQHYLHKFALAEGGSLPMINIPSTAGTGAEGTVGVVVMNEKGVKGATVIIGLHVEHVILDSELIASAPLNVTVWCAIDALSHGLEGCLADVESSEEDVFKSRECVRLVMENLPRLLDRADPEKGASSHGKQERNEGASSHGEQERNEDTLAQNGQETGTVLGPSEYHDTLQAMLLAAHYGGNAINTQLAGYVHAFAHSIGALYHIPHGKAIAWCLLPIVAAQENLRYEEMAALARYCHLAEAEDSDVEAADKLLLALRQLLKKCGLPEGCPYVKTEDYERLTEMIDLDSINYSPAITFTDADIRMLLDQIRRGY